eukprot:13866700-Ditylum_brightwellii.AAC.1
MSSNQPSVQFNIKTGNITRLLGLQTYKTEYPAPLLIDNNRGLFRNLFGLEFECEKKWYVRAIAQSEHIRCF